MSASIPLSAKTGAGLVVLAVALLTSEHLVHYAYALMMIGGLAAVARRPRALWQEADLRDCSLAFLALWLPMLASLPDAVNPAHATKTAFAYLHFWPAAIAIVLTLRHAAARRVVFAGVAAVIAFWLADAVLQFITGRDLFGHPPAGNILTGAFYPKQRLGLVLAVATPLYCLAVAGLARRWPPAWLLLLPLVLVILLSLKRTAWIMFAVSLAGLAWYACARRGRGSCRAVAAALALAAVVGAAAVTLDPALRARVVETTGLVSGDFAAMDRASSYRLTLWRTGLRIVEAHPVNGIGPRGYRHAYAAYAPPGDFWLARSGGQTHPHLMLLEVAIETGAIGLVGYACFLWLLLARLRRAADDTQAAWAICALAAAFPFNAHLAFYGSYWASLMWLAVAAAMAASSPGGPGSRTTRHY